MIEDIKEEIKRNLENYILQTNGKTYLTFETNTNLMARDCLNTIEQLISQLDIANKKLEDMKEYINYLVIFEPNIGRFNKTIWGEELLSIIGGE